MGRKRTLVLDEIAVPPICDLHSPMPVLSHVEGESRNAFEHSPGARGAGIRHIPQLPVSTQTCRKGVGILRARIAQTVAKARVTVNIREMARARTRGVAAFAAFRGPAIPLPVRITVRYAHIEGRERRGAHA